MAKTQIFSDPTDSGWGMLAASHHGGPVSNSELRPGSRLQVNACWLLDDQAESFNLFLDHRHGRILRCQGNGNLAMVDFDPKVFKNQAALIECMFRVEWDPKTGDLAYIVPKNHPQRAIRRNGRGKPLTLGASRDVDCRWKIGFPPVASAEPVPTYAGTTIDEAFFNIKAAYASGAGNECYLTIQNEQQVNSPVVWGRRADVSNAQFRLLPLPMGARMASGRRLALDGVDDKARLIAVAPDSTQRSHPDVALINLNGSRRFMTGDRVAFVTGHQRYLGVAGSSNDLIAYNWRPGASETFILERVTGRGELMSEHRFTLKASNGRYLREEAGGAIRATAATAADGNTAFMLQPPPANSAAFALVGRNSGHPLMLGAAQGSLRPLVQRFAAGAEIPLLFQLRRHEDAPNTFLLLCNDNPLLPLHGDGVDAQRGGGVGFVNGNVGIGTSFVLQKAPALGWPNTPDQTMESYRDPPEDYTRKIAGNAAQLAGSAASAVLEVSGGASVFSFVFNQLWPENKVSMFDLLNRFRADLLNDIKREIGRHAVVQADGALERARKLYLINYLTMRRTRITDASLLHTVQQALQSAINAYYGSVNFLNMSRKAGGGIEDTPANVEIAAGGLPIYAIYAAEYINLLQEAALLDAFRPDQALPDIYLTVGAGDYVVADPKAGVRCEKTSTPLTKAVRILNRSGDKVLHHGDSVILRAPAGTNVSAINGGGNELLATATHADRWEFFTVEKVAGGPVAAGAPIVTGDQVALRPDNKAFYLRARMGNSARPVSADAPHRAAWETFGIEIRTDDYIKSERDAGVQPLLQQTAREPDYMGRISILRDHALIEYRRIQEMYAFLLADRQSSGKHIYVDQHHESSRDSLPGTLLPGLNNKYALSFRDKAYNWNIDRVQREWGDKPAGWDNFENYGPLQQAMEQYRQHLAFTYFNFKYRHFEAARGLDTIADETEAMCRRIWDDKLAATAFSYAARTTPVFHA